MLSPICMRSLATIGYEMKKPLQIANLITTTRRTTKTRTTFVVAIEATTCSRVQLITTYV